MEKEIKICLPFYKIAYSIFFTAVLSLIWGVSFTFEIGVALEPQMALLAAVFCSDTYVQEIASRRSEVERLCPMKNRMISIFRRIGIQEIYLLILSLAGYGMFYAIQGPISLYKMQSFTESEIDLFLLYMVAITVTLAFWGIFSVLLSSLFRNMWAGIGGCLLLWIITDSTIGEKFFGKWNLFSYAFRDVEGSGDFSWVCGKMICIVFCILMAAVLPKIIKNCK